MGSEKGGGLTGHPMTTVEVAVTGTVGLTASAMNPLPKGSEYGDRNHAGSAVTICRGAIKRTDYFTIACKSTGRVRRAISQNVGNGRTLKRTTDARSAGG